MGSVLSLFLDSAVDRYHSKKAVLVFLFARNISQKLEQVIVFFLSSHSLSLSAHTLFYLSIYLFHLSFASSLPLCTHPPTHSPPQVRYAWFVTAVRALSRTLPNGQQPFSVEQQLSAKLVALRKALEEHLANVAKKINVPKKQAIFLIQNYEFVLGSLQDRGDIGACDETVYFADAQDRWLSAFVDEELNEKFGRLISFVKQSEAAEKQAAAAASSSSSSSASLAAADGAVASAESASASTSTPAAAAVSSASSAAPQRLESAVVESIVKGFAAAWKDAIEKISASVVASFGAGSVGGGGGGGGGAAAMNVRSHQTTVAMVCARVPQFCQVVKHRLFQLSRTLSVTCLLSVLLTRAEIFLFLACVSRVQSL